MLRKGVISRSAYTSSVRFCPVSSHTIRLLPPVSLAVITNSRGEVGTDSMTAGFPVRTRLIRDPVWINSEWPTMMCTLSGPCAMPGACWACGAVRRLP